MSLKQFSLSFRQSTSLTLGQHTSSLGIICFQASKYSSLGPSLGIQVLGNRDRAGHRRLSTPQSLDGNGGGSFLFPSLFPLWAVSMKLKTKSQHFIKKTRLLVVFFMANISIFQKEDIAFFGGLFLFWNFFICFFDNTWWQFLALLSEIAAGVLGGPYGMPGMEPRFVPGQ